MNSRPRLPYKWGLHLLTAARRFSYLFARFRLDVSSRLDKNKSLDGQFGISYEVLPDSANG